jgi:hypothetical protein
MSAHQQDAAQGGAVPIAPARRPGRATFSNGVPWTLDEQAALLPLVHTVRAPPGQVMALARRFGRTANSCSAQLRVLRTWTDEELQRLKEAAAMREAPRADGSGRCLPWVGTLTAAVQAPAPRPVSSAAGAVRAAPAGFFDRRAADKAEAVVRRCVACRVAFKAPHRFLFRCEPCRKRHTGEAYTGLDA